MCDIRAIVRSKGHFLHYLSVHALLFTNTIVPRGNWRESEVAQLERGMWKLQRKSKATLQPTSNQGNQTVATYSYCPLHCIAALIKSVKYESYRQVKSWTIHATQDNAFSKPVHIIMHAKWEYTVPQHGGLRFASSLCCIVLKNSNPTSWITLAADQVGIIDCRV